jgi:hypothetical protein
MISYKNPPPLQSNVEAVMTSHNHVVLQQSTDLTTRENVASLPDVSRGILMASVACLNFHELIC